MEYGDINMNCFLVVIWKNVFECGSVLKRLKTAATASREKYSIVALGHVNFPIVLSVESLRTLITLENVLFGMNTINVPV